VNTTAQPQLDPVERLKSTLNDAPRNREFLTRYVTEAERHRHEEDVFLRLAFDNATPGGVGSGPWIVSVVSELYEPLNPEQKAEVRRWWHEKMGREANQYESLRTRLSRIQ
jgi:hypothetical protein